MGSETSILATMGTKNREKKCKERGKKVTGNIHIRAHKILTFNIDLISIVDFRGGGDASIVIDLPNSIHISPPFHILIAALTALNIQMVYKFAA